MAVASYLNIPISELHKVNGHISDTNIPIPAQTFVALPELRTLSGTGAKLKSYAKKTGIPLADMEHANSHIDDVNAPVPPGESVYIPRNVLSDAANANTE